MSIVQHLPLQSKADPLGGGQHKANIKSGSISKGGRGSGSEEQPTTTPYHADSTDFNFPPQSMDSVDIDMGVDMGVDIDGLGPPRDERGAGGLDGNSRVRGFHDMICLGFVVSLCLNLGSMTARQEGFFAAEVKCLPEGAALTVLVSKPASCTAQSRIKFGGRVSQSWPPLGAAGRRRFAERRKEVAWREKSGDASYFLRLLGCLCRSGWNRSGTLLTNFGPELCTASVFSRWPFWSKKTLGESTVNCSRNRVEARFAGTAGYPTGLSPSRGGGYDLE